MPFPKTITLKDNLKFDFTNPESAIDYLIYITNPINYRLIVQNIILLGNEDALAEFVKNTTPISYKRAYVNCLLTTIPFHNIFMKTDLTFIFHDYLLDDSISELLRKNKLNNLRNNFREILNYISNQIDVKEFKKLDDNEAELLAKKFGEKYKLDDFHHKDNYFTYDYPITLSLFSHNLMLYCIGYRFAGFYSKLLNDYSSFLNVSDYIKMTIEKEEKSNDLTQEIDISELEFDSDIFKSSVTYTSFSEYKNKHIIDPYTDYSYLFQRMLHEKLIHKKTHFEYFDWLRDNGFIKDVDYDKFYVKSNFVSLNKSTSANRENNFNNIFKL